MARLSNLIPLLILVLVVAGGAYVAYQLYVWSNQMTQRGKQHMEKKNMTFTKDGGLKVGVKEMRSEAYEDRTQNVLVNVWNSSGYGQAPEKGSARNSAGRTNSRTHASGVAKASPPVSRSGNA